MELAWLSVYSLAVASWLMAFNVRHSAAQESDCTYTYTEHPGDLLQAEPACNPYGADARFSYRCTVTGPPGFEIVWFRNQERVAELDGVINITEVNNTDGSLTVILGFINLRVAGNYTGEYYCRVMVNGQSALPSNSSMLFGSDFRDYVQGSPCTDNIVSVEGDKCANLSVPSPTATAPPTTPTNDGSTQPPLGTDPETSMGSLSPSPSPSSSTSLPPTSDGSGTASPTDSTGSSSTPDLQVWLYVVVAVAAVFFLAIIILTIMCVGLCVRRSGKKTDPEESSHTDGGIKGQFTSNEANSMTSNGMYRQPDLTMCTFSSDPPMASPSKSLDTSDYNTLGERDYEVIKVFDPTHFDSRQTYQRLQRPSLSKGGSSFTMGSDAPELPSRNGARHLQSATTLPSAEVLGHEFRRGNSTSAIAFPPHIHNNSATSSSLQAHEYRTLEETRDGGVFFGSPTDSSPPDSAKYFERGDSMTKLLPHSRFRAASTNSSDAVGPSANESLYNPLFSNVLGDIPETGLVFPEPTNPTAFPVPAYDYATLNAAPTREGESTVIRKEPKNHQASEGNRISANYETDPKMDVLSSSTMNSGVAMKNELSTLTENGDFEDSITGFTVSPTLESNTSADFAAESAGEVEHQSMPAHTPPFPVVSSGDSTPLTPARAHTADFNKPSSSQGHTSSPNSLPNFVKDAHLNAKNSNVGLSTLEYEDNDTSSSDFTGPIIFPHMLEKQTQSTSLPHSRQHYYKKLDPSSLDPVVKYTDLQFRGITTV